MPDANQATGSEGGYEKCGIQYCHSPCIAVDFMACRIEQLTGASSGLIFLGTKYIYIYISNTVCFQIVT